MSSPAQFSDVTVRRVAAMAGTPAYVYDERALRELAASVLAFPNAFGLTARYAMKAWSNAAVLRLFSSMGMHVDASSGYEAHRAIRAGVKPEWISLSSQELPTDFEKLLERGVTLNACSLLQLERFGHAFPGGRVGLRINPGLGSGGTSKTNVGGPASSFGIWHENLDQVDAIIEKYNLDVFRVHSHIGSGSDPAVWLRVAEMNMALVERFPGVTVLNLGGGFKVGRMEGEVGTDLQLVGQPVKKIFEDFAVRTGRKIHLEVEPGTYLVANAGAILATIQDSTDTGAQGYRFLKLDSGMTENCRPSLYGARHPMRVIPREPGSNGTRQFDYVVAGHCCESGDMHTPKDGDAETLEPRSMDEAKIGDFLLIEGAGAYCSAMSTVNYNSFPQAAEVLIREDGTPVLIRRRQILDQMLQNEVPI